MIEEQKRQYELIKVYAEEQGVSIFNAAKNGFLDSFPRVEYETLF